MKNTTMIKEDKMRFIILSFWEKPFTTNWFDGECHFSEGDFVIDVEEMTYTKDGKNWLEIEQDHL